MASPCSARHRGGGGASASITFIAMATHRGSRSAPVALTWTRIDRPSRANEVTRHQFGKGHDPVERQESSTAASAGPAKAYSGSRGPLAVAASAIPAHSTGVMVRARVAAKPASREPATAGVDGWERPLCRRFLSPTSSPVKLRHLRASRARRGRSCALNLATPISQTTIMPTSLLRSSSPAVEARAGLDATWWCAVFAAIRPTCASSRGWSPASRRTSWRPNLASNHRQSSRTPRTPTIAISSATRHDAASWLTQTNPADASLVKPRKESSAMPPVDHDPSTRAPVANSRARRVVRVGLYQRWPTLTENDFLRAYVASQPGWRVALRSSDYGSGGTLKRPGLQRMLTAARSGAIDVLVVGHMYNLSRVTRHLAILLAELTSRGVRVVSVADPAFDTETSHGLFLVRVVSAVAEIEQAGVLADRRDRRRHEQQSGDKSRRRTLSPSRATHSEMP